MKTEQKIPKIIHYCWFGQNPLPEMAVRCIESWKKYCPDYEIRRWDEDSFDLNCCRYVQEAYQTKKWAFVSDVARLYALVEFGGIYLDTDVELMKPLDDALLSCSGFLGLESENRIATALIAAAPNHPFYKELLNSYIDESFIKSDGTLNTTTNVKRITQAFAQLGFVSENRTQVLGGIAIFPIDYFCPKDFTTGEIRVTENTYAIHHFDGSWWTEEQKYAGRLTIRFRKILPEKPAKRLAKAVAVMRFRGVKGILQESRRRLRK